MKVPGWTPDGTKAATALMWKDAHCDTSESTPTASSAVRRIPGLLGYRILSRFPAALLGRGGEEHPRVSVWRAEEIVLTMGWWPWGGQAKQPDMSVGSRTVCYDHRDEYFACLGAACPLFQLRPLLGCVQVRLSLPQATALPSSDCEMCGFGPVHQPYEDIAPR